MCTYKFVSIPVIHIPFLTEAKFLNKVDESERAPGCSQLARKVDAYLGWT